jgi:hypothetical protein
MPNYPKEIPAQFSANEALADAYSRGWNHGHGFACHNVPRLGDTLWIDSLGKITIDAENIREAHQSICFEAESNSRSYSPFEFTANEFNENEELSEELWEAFDNGIADSIFADLESYTDSDYGIEQSA